MKVFVLSFDCHFDCCGSWIKLIGVFQSEDKVQAAIDQTKAEYVETIDDYRDRASYWNKKSDSEIEKEINEHFTITPVNIDEVIDQDLGGYVE